MIFVSLCGASPALAEPPISFERVPPPTTVKNPAMIEGGSVMIVLGALCGVGAGAFLPWLGREDKTEVGEAFGYLGAGFLGTGIAFLGIGIPLVVAGAQRVRVEAPTLSLGLGRVDVSGVF